MSTRQATATGRREELSPVAKRPFIECLPARRAYNGATASPESHGGECTHRAQQPRRAAYRSGRTTRGRILTPLKCTTDDYTVRPQEGRLNKAQGGHRERPLRERGTL